MPGLRMSGVTNPSVGAVTVVWSKSKRASARLEDDTVFFSGGDLLVAAATAQSQWTDWRVIHVEKGPFLNEMLADPYRWRSEGVLSVMVQQSPKENHQSTPLRVLDFAVSMD